MKYIKIQNSLLAILLVIICSSCNDWLSVSPRSQTKEEDMFKTEEGFKNVITGIYTGMCAKELYGAALTYGAIDVLGGYYYMGWSQRENIYYSLSSYDYENTSSLNVIDSIWSKQYNLIANANIILRNVDKQREVFTEDNYRLCKGEALALRAFLHFDLLRMFGKSYLTGKQEEAIPYVENLDLQITPLSTVEEIMDKVIRDLEEAASLMDKDPIINGESSNSFLGTRQFRLNYYTVKSLLSRVYLYKGDKLNALKNAKEVIDSEKYPWTPREEITVAEDKNRNRIFNSELIFALNNNKLETYSNEFLQAGASESQANVLFMDGSIISSIYESSLYGNIDWRYVYFFKEDYAYSNKLWQIEGMPDDYANKQPLIRISEMYLIAAECETDETAALKYFNEFRHARGFTADLDLDNAANLQNEIIKEYRKEFIQEGQFWFCCKRLNMIVPDADGFKTEAFVLPLPEIEIEYGNRFQK